MKDKKDYKKMSKRTYLMLKQISLFTFAVVLLCFAGCNKKAQTSGQTGYRDEELIITSDIYDLPATLCIPDGEGPFPAVVMLHGTGSNRNEAGNGYVYASHELASKYRIASIHIDFPGSDLSDADSTLYEYDPAQSEDIVDASDNGKSRLILVEGMDHTLNIFSEEDKHTLYKVIDETGNFFTDTLK